MANRRFNNQQFAFMPGVVSIYGRVTFGAAGAPTLDQATQNSMGILSVVRNSAGNYTFTFGSNTQLSSVDTYFKFLSMAAVFNETGTSAAPASPSYYITSNLISSTGKVTVQFNAAGTATDPASGEILHIKFDFRNSSAP